MGRPPRNAGTVRSVVRSVRVTPVEQKVLEKRYGSVSKALRVLIDRDLSGSTDSRTTKSVPSADRPFYPEVFDPR